MACRSLPRYLAYKQLSITSHCCYIGCSKFWPLIYEILGNTVKICKHFSGFPEFLWRKKMMKAWVKNLSKKSRIYRERNFNFLWTKSKKFMNKAREISIFSALFKIVNNTEKFFSSLIKTISLNSLFPEPIFFAKKRVSFTVTRA